jgi:ABC-type glycerol-3-phosphate transport system substrate-binding protein
MRKTGGLLLPLFLAASLALAGCGGDEDGESTVTTATTISPTQTSVPVGPNTTANTVAQTSTTGQ